MFKKFKMKAKVPDLGSFIGREVKIPGLDKPVIIEKICGNLGMSLGRTELKPQYYEINGEHLISMLRFHAQMTGDRSITEDQFKAFEEIEFAIEKAPLKKSALEVPKTLHQPSIPKEGN